MILGRQPHPSGVKSVLPPIIITICDPCLGQQSLNRWREGAWHIAKPTRMLTTYEWVNGPTTQRLMLKIVAIYSHWVFPVTRLIYNVIH